MYNPRKEKPKFTPYSQPVPPFYPSQSMDFIPLHLGGMNTPQYPAPFRGGGVGSSTGGVGSSCGGGGYRNQTGTEYKQRRNRQPNGNDLSGRHGSYNRRPQQYNRGGFQGRFQHQQQGYNGRQYHNQQQQQTQQNHQVKKNENRDIFKEYFHKSMLEDPWKELLERHEALNSSSFAN